jgi:hypothetical protein
MQIDHRDIERGEILAWVRWECIRRNPKYVKDWVAFDCEFGPWFEKNGYWWDKSTIYDEHAWYFLCSKVGPAAKTICERWKITDPFPPSWKFGSGCMRKEGRATVVIPTFDSDHHRWNLKAIDPTLFPDPDDRFEEELKDLDWEIADNESSISDPRCLRVEIDVTEPMKQILNHVEREVEFAKRIYENKIGPMPEETQRGHPTRIKGIEDYSVYLRVWDWRQQGMTFEKIAALEFRKEMSVGSRRNPVVDRVRSQYKRACELMDWATEK